MKKKLILLSIQLLFGNILLSYYQSECIPEPMVCMVPECENYNANFFAEASALYWHPKVYGTEFASESVFINNLFLFDNEGGTPDVSKASIKGCVKSVDLSWDWGFKAGIGYRLPCYDWNIHLNYIGFDSKGCESTCVHMNNEYIANYRPFLFNSFIMELKEASIFVSRFLSRRAKSKVCMNSDALQINLGKFFSICESLVLQPKIGLEFFWIKLRQNTRYLSVKPLLLLEDKEGFKATLLFNYEIRDRSKFSGVGPYFSFETKWYLYNNLSLYGNVSGTLLYGLFKICHNEKMHISPAKELSDDDDNDNDNEDSQKKRSELLKLLKFNNCIHQLLHAIVPSVGHQIGLVYNTSLNCDKIHFLFRLAFDAQYFWRMNQILQARDATMQYERISEDISMHGVTFDIRIDF